MKGMQTRRQTAIWTLLAFAALTPAFAHTGNTQAGNARAGNTRTDNNRIGDNRGDIEVRKVGATQSLMVNGRPVQRDMTPRMINGTVMVPIRFVAEYLGGSVDWRPDQRLVQVMQGRNQLAMTVGTTRAMLNGEGRAMAAPPVIVGGRTLIPLREVGRFFNAQVQYNPSTRTVFVNTLGGGDGPPATPGSGL